MRTPVRSDNNGHDQVVDWLNEDEDDDPPKTERHNEEDEDDWTREYNIDQEIANHERLWDSRFQRLGNYCRGMDVCIVLSLWGCSSFYYYYYFVRMKKMNHHHDRHHEHLIVLLLSAMLLLGLCYAIRGMIGVATSCQKILTCGILVVQISLCVALWLLHSQYHYMNHSALLFHFICSISGIAVASEVIRLMLVVFMIHRRRQRRRNHRDGSSLEEPLLEGEEWQIRQQEWASRTEEDPLWWSRDEEPDEESTISGRQSCR